MNQGKRVYWIFMSFLLILVSGYAESFISLKSSDLILVMPSLAIALLSVYFLGSVAVIPVTAAAAVLSLAGIITPGDMNFPGMLSALLVATGFTLAAWWGGLSLRIHFRKSRDGIFTVPAFFRFLFLGTLIPALINALFMTLALMFLQPQSGFTIGFMSRMLAGTIGVLLLVPFILTWNDHLKIELTRYRMIELLIFLLVLFPYIFIISSITFRNPTINILLGYILTPVFIWLAVRFESKMTTLILFVTMTVFIILAMMGTNPQIISVFRNPGLMLQGFIVVISLITFLSHAFFLERLRLLQSVSKRESELKSVLENMPVALAIMNIRDGMGYVNTNFVRLTGYDIHDVEGVENWFEKAYPDPEYRKESRMRWNDAYHEAREQGTTEHEFRIRTRDGDMKDIHFVMSILGDSFLVGLNDVTHRKQMMERVQESERRMNTLVQNIQGMVFQCRNNSARTMIFVSEGAFALTGYLPSDFTSGKIDLDNLVEERFRDYVWTTIQSAVKRGEPYELQYRLRANDGQIRWVSEKGKAWYTGEGVCSGIEGLIIDITDRVNILESLRISEQRYKSLFENIPLSLWEDDYSEAVRYLDRLAGEDDYRYQSLSPREQGS